MAFKRGETMTRMLSISTLGLLVALSVLSVVPVAAAPSTTITLRVENSLGEVAIKGDSTVPGHLNEILALSFSFDQRGPATGGDCADFTVAKHFDRASPVLLRSNFAAIHYPLAVISFLDTATKTPKLLFTITLRTVVVLAYQIGASAGTVGKDPLVAAGEKIVLGFEQIFVTDAESGVTRGWDCVTNREL